MKFIKGGMTMRRTMIPALRRALILGLILTVDAGLAFAHGERAQEGFLRMKTAAWQDVRFSSNEVKQGESLVITGKVKVLEAWPATLASPELG
jgi:methane/ammonia monooxygenase subunit B